MWKNGKFVICCVAIVWWGFSEDEQSWTKMNNLESFFFVKFEKKIRKN